MSERTDLIAALAQEVIEWCRNNDGVGWTYEDLNVRIQMAIAHALSAKEQSR